MADDNRLIEIMAELLAEARETKTINAQMAANIGELNSQMAKNNLVIGELRLSVMRLADQVAEMYHLDQRVRVLEEIVLPKQTV